MLMFLGKSAYRPSKIVNFYKKMSSVALKALCINMLGV